MTQDAATEAPAYPPHRWGLPAFLLVEAILLASAGLVAALLTRGGGRFDATDVLVGTIAPTVIAAVAAVAVTSVRGNGPVLDLRLQWRWDDVVVGLKFGALGLVVSMIAVGVWTQAVGVQEAHSAVSVLVSTTPFSVQAAVVMFVYLWLLGPVCEEIIYRGLLWGAVERLGRDHRGARWAALVVSTAVFAVGHLEPLRAALLVVMAIPIGLARLYTGRLCAGIVVHQVTNFLPAVAILLSTLGVVHV